MSGIWTRMGRYLAMILFPVALTAPTDAADLDQTHLDGVLFLAALLAAAAITALILHLRAHAGRRQQARLNQLVAHRTAELHQALAALERLAGIDVVTDIMNRRRFLELAAREIDRTRRHSHAMCVAMLDIDHFKQINDCHGHATGDEVLRHVASVMQRACRNSDLVARYGGEEFVLLLPETGMEGGMLLLERVRANIAAYPPRAAAGSVDVTVSIGLAAWQGPGDDLPSILNRADAALYDAKRAGRNRIHLAQMTCSVPHQALPGLHASL